MAKPELNAIGYLLIRAGSDSASIILNARDTELLGLDDCNDIVEIEVTPPRMQGYMTAEMPDYSPKKVKRQAVEPIRLNSVEDDPDEVIKSYNVHVGTARKAHKAKMAGRSIDGLRQPDPKVPVAQQESANA